MSVFDVASLAKDFKSYECAEDNNTEKGQQTQIRSINVDGKVYKFGWTDDIDETEEKCTQVANNTEKRYDYLAVNDNIEDAAKLRKELYNYQRREEIVGEDNIDKLYRKAGIDLPRDVFKGAAKNETNTKEPQEPETISEKLKRLTAKLRYFQCSESTLGMDLAPVKISRIRDENGDVYPYGWIESRDHAKEVCPNKEINERILLNMEGRKKLAGASEMEELYKLLKVDNKEEFLRKTQEQLKSNQEVYVTKGLELQRALVGIEGQIKDVEEKDRKVVEELEKTQGQEEEITNLRSDKDNLDKTIEELTRLLTEANQSNKENQKKLEELQGQKEEISKLKSDTNELDKKFEELKRSMAEADQRNEEKLRKLEELQGQKEEISKLKSEKLQLQEQIRTVNGLLTEAKAITTSTQTKLNECMQKVEGRASLKAAHDKYLQELADLRKRVGDLEEMVKQIDRLSTTEAEISIEIENTKKPELMSNLLKKFWEMQKAGRVERWASLLTGSL